MSDANESSKKLTQEDYVNAIIEHFRAHMKEDVLSKYAGKSFRELMALVQAGDITEDDADKIMNHLPTPANDPVAMLRFKVDQLIGCLKPKDSSSAATSPVIQAINNYIAKGFKEEYKDDTLMAGGRDVLIEALTNGSNKDFTEWAKAQVQHMKDEKPKVIAAKIKEELQALMIVKNMKPSEAKKLLQTRTSKDEATLARLAGKNKS